MHIKADNIIYDKKHNTYYANGHCLIYNSTYTIKSDKASYDRKTQTVNLQGNIMIEDKNKNWIRGSDAVINLSTYKGFVDNATMFTHNNKMYIRAKRIILQSKNKYYMADGIITGCRCSGFIKGKKGIYPKWSVSAKHTYLVKNDYIFAYPAIFRARSVPLFFLPVLYKGLSNKRKTGFLLPAAGYSSRNGFEYEQPFFININKSQDITLNPFIYSKAGKGIKVKYRFYWTKNSKGTWESTLFKEKNPYGTSQNKKLRITLKANQYADLGNYGNFNYDLNIVNNKDNLRVLNKDDIELTSDRYTKSTASYSISDNAYSLNINGYFYQDLVSDNNRATLQKLPEIKFNITNKKLWKNLTLDFAETAANDFRIEGNRGYSNTASGFLSYPFKVSYFNIVPRIGAHELYAYWENAPYNKHSSRRSFIPDYSIQAKTSLYGIYLTSNKTGLLGFKHIITPTLTYQYIPYRDQSKFPDFVSTYEKTNLTTMTLENSIISKTKENGKIKYREVFYNKISQGYDFAKTNHFPFPPIFEETRFSPLEYLIFSSKAYFSTQKGKFVDSDESLNIKEKRAGASFGYVMSRYADNMSMSDESAKMMLYVYPVKSLYTYVYIEKSLHNGYYPQRKVGFMYNEDCWGLGIDLYINEIADENDDGTYSRKKNTGFWITFVLRGLGAIKRQY